jgi:hypothetical protein
VTSGMLIAWLLAPIDGSRPHEISEAMAWHGRLMTVAWGVLVPLGVVIARYFKVTPRQDWPRQLDNRFWWLSHLTCQYSGGILMLAGLIIILSAGRPGAAWLHAMMGYAVLAFGALQFLAGWLRGSKGGPSEANPRGDHYDMTPRRLAFEHIHKTVGYGALLLAGATILTGLWTANAPHWMWLGIMLWWVALVAAALALQAKGRYVSSYHAIWGPDPAHPGNRR